MGYGQDHNLYLTPKPKTEQQQWSERKIKSRMKRLGLKQKATCVNCNASLDDLDLQYGCLRCKVKNQIMINASKKYSKIEKQFLKSLDEVLENC